MSIDILIIKMYIIKYKFYILLDKYVNELNKISLKYFNKHFISDICYSYNFEDKNRE